MRGKYPTSTISPSPTTVQTPSARPPLFFTQAVSDYPVLTLQEKKPACEELMYSMADMTQNDPFYIFGTLVQNGPGTLQNLRLRWQNPPYGVVDPPAIP